MADTVVWSIQDGDYPFLDEFPILYNIEYTSDVLWQISDGNYPYKKSFPQMTGITDVSDNIWVIKDGGYPYKRIFPDSAITGACMGCTNLTSVEFPNTLTSIGRYSFKDTGLTHVTLPASCTYYSTSFPPGCTITGGVLIG